MATEQELNDRLQKIQGDAQEQHRLHVGARNLLHRNLAEAYVWWLEAIKQPKGYLQGIFKANAIETRSTSNDVNFNPIVRLVFKMQAANAGTVSQWSAALLVVHEYYQPVPVDQISYNWKIDADKRFVTRFYRKQLDRWLVKVKKNIHLASNKTIKLVLADRYLEARSHFVKDQPGVNEEGYARFADDYFTLYGRDAKIERLTDAPSEITVSPLDIAELFATLTNVPTKGRIMIRGNAHIMNVSYETATAKHEAFIPACDHEGKRDATYFKRYVPNA